MSATNPDYVPQNIQTPLAWHYTSGKAADESDTVAAFPGVLDINDVLGSNGTYLPPPGMVGEGLFVERSPGGAIGLVNAAPMNILTLTLPPGDWDVWGTICVEMRNLAQSVVYLMASLTPVGSTNVIYPNQTTSTVSFGNAAPLNGVPFIAAFAPVITTTTMPLPMYLNVAVNWVNGTAYAYGNIAARRRR